MSYIGRPRSPYLEQLEAELAKRAKDDLGLFTRQAWRFVENRDYVHGWHIDAKNEHLAAVSSGQIKRLIINEPPRHMKSLTCNVFWPTWDWIENPGRVFLFASYKATLSTRDNVRARRIIESSWYKKNYGIQLRDDQNTKARFENNKNGERLIATVNGSGATGEGGDVIVIDDALSADEARSKASLKNCIDWYEESMKSRLNDQETGVFVVIMQRLNEDDLAGHILASETGWDHLCLPARYEPDHPFPIRSSIGFQDPRTEAGELLWKDRFTEKGYTNIAPEGSYVEAGQLQQRPAPRSGGLFQRDDFQIIDSLPPIKKWIRAWDLAGSVDGDWTVGVLMGEREDGLGYVVVNVVRFRKRPGTVKEKIKATAESDNERGPVPIRIPQDPGQAGVAQKDDFAAYLAGNTLRFVLPTGDKETRASPFASQCEVGRVYLLKAGWNEAFINELSQFPRGKYDDQVDASADAFNELTGGKQHEFW
ncbi:MAG: phage terminase large subunit [Pseudomonadota bacterium]